MFTCGWCGTSYPTWQSHCDSCGGPLPPPPGRDIGPEPPNPPRKLPIGFERRIRWTENVLVIIGAIFSVVGVIPVLLFTQVHHAGILVFAIFLVMGIAMFVSGWKKAAHTLRAFKHGRAVKGEITEVYLDTTETINNRHPWRISYKFDADGQMMDDYAKTWDASAALRSAGQPLWVLYVVNDPSQNTIYPPVR